MVIAWLKLRQRNLGPLLDANGWPSIPVRRSTSPSAGSYLPGADPLGSKRNLVDPYHQSIQGRVWTIVILVLLLLAGLWYFGAVERVCQRWRGEADAPPTTQPTTQPVVTQTER